MNLEEIRKYYVDFKVRACISNMLHFLAEITVVICVNRRI